MPKPNVRHVMICLLGIFASSCTSFNEKEIKLQKPAVSGDLDRVKHLVEVEKVNINEQDRLGFTALHWASISDRNLPIIKYLISKGADPTIEDRLNSTPFGQFGSQVDMRFVEDQEAKYRFIAIFDFYLSTGKVDINERNSLGNSVIVKPVVYGYYDVVKFMLNRGANPNIDVGLVYKHPLIEVARSQLKEAEANRAPGDSRGIEEFREDMAKTIALLENHGVGGAATSARVRQVPRAGQAANASGDAQATQHSGGVQPAVAGGDREGGLADPARGIANDAADCLKLNASLKVCERLPWPASTGCRLLAQSNFDHAMCKYVN